MMFMPWMLFFIITAACHEVFESQEETSTNNVTTLYPVTNKTIENIKIQRKNTEAKVESHKSNVIENEQDVEDSEKNETVDVALPKKDNTLTMKIDTTYTVPKHEEKSESNSTDSIKEMKDEKPTSKSIEKEFKPSPHLGSFFDDENLKQLKFPTSEPFINTGKKSPLDFVSSKDLFMLNYKSPKNSYRDQTDVPYRFENSYFPDTQDWKHTLDSNPTIESPIKIPAGGLYKHSDPFKEKPSSNGDDEDFGLSFNEDEKQKEYPIKKRANPWKHLLHIITAFLPVGLIISALTPSVITIQSTNNDPHLNRFSRRSDEGFADIPPISERCKRRLLCEIHSEENYIRSQKQPSRYVRKHCYKIRCEDPHALNKVLRWLLAHQPGSPGPTSHHPGSNYLMANPDSKLSGPGHQVQLGYHSEHSDMRQYHKRSFS